MEKLYIVIFIAILSLNSCGVISNYEDNYLEFGIEKELKNQGISFSDILEVKVLDLSNLHIENISGISKFENLETLNLSNNIISSIDELSKLENLKILDLQNNIIEDFTPISKLEKLEVLLIRNNDSRDISVFKNIFDQLITTDFLIDIKILDEKLESIIKKNLNIDRKIELEDIGKLKVLDLRDEEVYTLKGLENFVYLEELYILGSIDDINLIGNLKNLKKLTINESEINDVLFLKNLTSIEILNLKHNNIKDIEVLTNLTDIETLDLSYNRIVDISSINKLNKIKELYLFSNRIEDLYVIENVFDNIEKTDIRFIFFNDYNLDMKVREILKKEEKILTLNDLKNIRELDISSSNIEDLGGISLMTNLISLNISDNFINSLDNIKELENIKILKLKNNKIEDITVLSYLSNLEVLDLSFNDISNIEPLIYLKDLKYLYLEENKIENIELLDELKIKLKGIDGW